MPACRPPTRRFAARRLLRPAFAACALAVFAAAHSPAACAQAASAASITTQPPAAAVAPAPDTASAPRAAQPPGETAASAGPAVAAPPPPSVLYGSLYREVELAQVFDDSKTFADRVPTAPPAQIVAAWRADAQLHSPDSGTADAAARKAALTAFVNRYFAPPPHTVDRYVSDPNQSVADHIDTLWNVLSRAPDTATQQAASSLLPLPYPYVVPGGRFDEIYYWDSYFIMLGLEASGRHALALDELNNFAALIDRYGHIPNGNRTYYLSRSQPPFFAQMVNLVAARDGDSVYLRYLPQLEREYAYWMDGAENLAPDHAYRHVVRLADGTLLNRYWDARDTPRDESYREDVLTARATPQRNAADLWRNLRAGGETGWDFSSRWFADGRTLSSIDVTSLAPVDLNCLLVELERTLAKAYGLEGDARDAQRMTQRAAQRTAAIDHVLWDPRLHAFGDYDFVHRRLTHRLTAAALFPLYDGVATRAQARETAAAVRAGLLRPGGLATTEVQSGQQWDEPNGWAPLQYVAVVGLRRYGDDALAQTIATRWIAANLAGYQRTHKLVEKYDISAAGENAAAGGGEYPLQDGFGWTNGVLRTLLLMYPQAATQAPQAAPGASAGTETTAP
ncbi:alpha,alpha-trehalase TreF [Burkholderia sp. WAC0059]|uniref:alpha,alpha-trehalase TreF n=1 Tax=Burkholderia sp. WAC0059 TaxID=2066022 RepID=UPI00215568F4|nr:alpha,alpha-trehalase TreF [Burkholderia sp. WAC0059]